MSYPSPESEGAQVVAAYKHHADLEYAGSFQPGMAGLLPPINKEGDIDKEGRICGFQKRTAWAMAIILIILIAIAGIAWGIEATIQSRNSKHNQASSVTTPAGSATTSSSTSSISSISTASTTQASTSSAESSKPTSTAVTDAANCPAVNGTTYTNSGYTFVKYCNVELLPTPTQPNDLTHQYTSSFDDCIQACITYNINVNKTCVGVTWDIYDPTNYSVNEMCFLKTQGGYLQNAYLDSQKICDSAMLVTSP